MIHCSPFLHLLLKFLQAFRLFSRQALAFRHGISKKDEFDVASIVPRFTAVYKSFPSQGQPIYVKASDDEQLPRGLIDVFVGGSKQSQDKAMHGLQA